MQTIINDRLTEMYGRMRNQCLADFELNGSLGSRCYALKPNMAPIRFNLQKMMLPLPLLGLHDSGYMPLKAAINTGQIVAVFVGREGFMDDPESQDITIDWAHIGVSDFLWFEIVGRHLRHYEAFHIVRSGLTPELEQIPPEKIKTGPSDYVEMFKLHS
jgi:hypothetical protein